MSILDVIIVIFEDPENDRMGVLPIPREYAAIHRYEHEQRIETLEELQQLQKSVSKWVEDRTMQMSSAIRWAEDKTEDYFNN